jgi:hypothetical protein
MPTNTSLHPLEVPINIGKRQLLLHRVHGGESFELVSQTFFTSTDVIRSLNYSLPPTLWADSVIVVAPDLQTVDPSLPAFNVFEVTETSTLDLVARKLNLPPQLLEWYNECTGSCSVVAGDWLIVPVLDNP